MKENAKDNFFNNKNDLLNNNSDRNNKLVKGKDNKKLIKNISIIKFSLKEINYKLKKIMFIDNITIISNSNKINFKLSTNKKLWKPISKNKKKDDNKKKNNMKLFK